MASESLYVFFRESDSGFTAPVQPNTVEQLPFEPSFPNVAFTPFWNPVFVTVPDNYIAESVCSEQNITRQGYPTASQRTLTGFCFSYCVFSHDAHT